MESMVVFRSRLRATAGAGVGEVGMGVASSGLESFEYQL